MTKEEIASLGIEDLITRDPMHDPKYSLIEGRILHRTKGYLLPTDEPFYVLRGNDPFAITMAGFYNKVLAGEEPTQITLGHMDTSSERVETFRKYQEENPTMVGRMYPEKGCSCITEPPFMMGSPDDQKQNSEWFPYSFRLFHRDLNFYIPDTEPLMIFRGKDQVLVVIMKQHLDFIHRNAHLYENADQLGDYIQKQIDDVVTFQVDNPTRCGATCSIHQKLTNAVYSDAMKDLMISQKERIDTEDNVDVDAVLARNAEIVKEFEDSVAPEDMGVYGGQ